MLLAVKYFEIFPKDNLYGFISEFLALNWYVYVVLMNDELWLPLSWRLKQNILCDLEKLIEYSTSAVIAASSNRYVGPLRRIRYPFCYNQYELINYCLL